MATTILDHIIGQVSAVVPEEVPFPHFFIREFFPRSVYERLLDSLPDHDLYQPFGYDGSRPGDEGHSRSRFRFEDDSLDRLPFEHRKLWYAIRASLGSTEFRQTVFGKLRSGLSRRFGCHPDEAGLIPGFSLPELFRETAGYRIKPHPDTNAKVVTMQICLARDESQSALGTEFYRMSLLPTSLFREPRGFKVARRMPFTPNAAYAFVVLNTPGLKSWHGRTTLPGTAGVRHSLLNFWYATPERANKDLLTGTSAGLKP